MKVVGISGSSRKGNTEWMIRMLLLRAIKLIGIRLRIYQEILPGWERYRSKEFDKTHF